MICVVGDVVAGTIWLCGVHAILQAACEHKNHVFYLIFHFVTLTILRPLQNL